MQSSRKLNIMRLTRHMILAGVLVLVPVRASMAVVQCPPAEAECNAAAAPMAATGVAIGGVATILQTVFAALMQYLKSAGATADITAEQLRAQVKGKIANAEIQNKYENLQRRAKMDVAEKFAPDVGRQGCVVASGQRDLAAVETNTVMQAALLAASAEDRLLNRTQDSSAERMQQVAASLGGGNSGGNSGGVSRVGGASANPASANPASAVAAAPAGAAPAAGQSRSGQTSSGQSSSSQPAREIAAARGMLADVNKRFEDRMHSFQDCKSTNPQDPRCRGADAKEINGALPDMDINPRSILVHDILRLRQQAAGEQPDWARAAAKAYCDNVVLPTVLDPVRGNLANANPVYLMKLRGWQASNQLAFYTCQQIIARRMPVAPQAGSTEGILTWGRGMMKEAGYTIPDNVMLSEHKIMELMFSERFSTRWHIAASSAPDTVKLRYINQSLGTLNQLKWRKNQLIEQIMLLEATLMSADKKRIPHPVLPAGAQPVQRPLPKGYGSVFDVPDENGVMADVEYIDFALGALARVPEGFDFFTGPGSGSGLPIDACRLGTITARYESNGNPNSVNSDAAALRDRGGKSFGSYQLAGAAGSVHAFVRGLPANSPVRQRLEPLLPPNNGRGSTPTTWRAFENAWKSINDPNFAEMQHEYIRRVNYGNAVNNFRRQGGWDMNDIRVQQAMWSIGVQHGNVGALLSKFERENPNWRSMDIESQLRALYRSRGGYCSAATGGWSSACQGRYTREIEDIVRASCPAAAPAAPTRPGG